MADRAAERVSGMVPVWQQDQWDAADAHRSRWRLVGLAGAAAAWVYPSVLAWFLLVIGSTGFDAAEHVDGGVSGGVLDGGAEGAAAFVTGLVIELLAGASLVFVARWALGRRRTAVVVGIGATVWLQLLVTWAVLA
jgi:hypothetical protein